MNGLAKPILIPVCCICGLAREEGQAVGSSDESWGDLDKYVDRHDLRGVEYKLTHGYCPTCAQLMTVKKKTMSMDDGPGLDEAVPVTEVIMEILGRGKPYEMDALVESCPQYSWNQIFLEVDRLSRNGTLQLTMSERGHYAVRLAECSVVKEVFNETFMPRR